MSETRDKFFELLSPSIEAEGFVFHKSKKMFTKVNNDLVYNIDFSWDGRGGTTVLNNVSGSISIPYVSKALKILVKTSSYPIYIDQANYNCFDRTIPQMYSKALLDLANNMAFKKMSAMSFEEKYPLAAIEKTVNVIKNKILQNTIPSLYSITTDRQIMDSKIELLLTQLNEIDTHNIMREILIVKIISKKLQIAEPKFIQDIKIFTNKSIDDSWNMQNYDFEKMEEKFNNLKF